METRKVAALLIRIIYGIREWEGVKEDAKIHYNVINIYHCKCTASPNKPVTNSYPQLFCGSQIKTARSSDADARVPQLLTMSDDGFAPSIRRPESRAAALMIAPMIAHNTTVFYKPMFRRVY